MSSPNALQSTGGHHHLLRISSDFWHVCNTLADLKWQYRQDKVLSDATGEGLQNDFPQVVVVGDQNCGKSSLLNFMTCEQMGIPPIFPVDDGQCTTRPFMFTLQYRPEPEELDSHQNKRKYHIEVTYRECDKSEDQKVEFEQTASDDPKFYATTETFRGQALDYFLGKLNEFEGVLNLLKDVSECSSSRKVLKLAENWRNTVVRIKLIVFGSDPSPGSLCEFVDLPGLVRHSHDMYKNAGIPNPDDIRYSDLRFDVKNDEAFNAKSYLDAKVKPAWFNFLVHMFLQKPTTLVLHVIKSEAEEEQVMSIKVIGRVKHFKLEVGSLKAKLVKVFTKVDQSIRAEKPTKGLLCNFANEKHEVFCDTKEAFFVGCLGKDQRDVSGSYCSRCPLTLGLLMRGPEVDVADSSALQDYCQKLASESSFGALVVRHEGVLGHVGPVAVKKHVVDYLGTNMRAFLSKLTVNCRKASDELREDILKLEFKYPLIKEGDFILSIEEWLEALRVFACVLIGFDQSPQLPMDCMQRYRQLPDSFHENIANFQSTYMKHLHNAHFRRYVPRQYKEWKKVQRCSQFQILTGKYPKCSYQSNRELTWTEAKLSETGVSRPGRTKVDMLPFDQLFNKRPVLECESGGFNDLVLVERSVHALVNVILDDALIDRKTFQFVKTQETGLDSRISGDWCHSFFHACHSLLEDAAADYARLSKEFFESKEGPAYGKFEGFQALQKMFADELKVVLEDWLYEKAKEMQEKRNIVFEGQGAMLISEICYLDIICQSSCPQNPQHVPIIFEQAVTIIAEILKKRWHELRQEQCPTQPKFPSLDPVIEPQELDHKSESFVPSEISIDHLAPYGGLLSANRDVFQHIQTLLTDARNSATALMSQPGGLNTSQQFKSKCDALRDQILEFQSLFSDDEVRVTGQSPSIISVNGRSEQRATTAVKGIKVNNVKSHFIKASPSAPGYNEDSLFWCLQVSLSNLPCQIIFRTLKQFKELWETMQEFGIILEEKNLPSRGFFSTLWLRGGGYHHSDFIDEASRRLQESLTKIVEKIQDANPDANEKLLKWLEFTEFHQSEYSDAEICEARQARHCDQIAKLTFQFDKYSSQVNQRVEKKKITAIRDYLKMNLSPDKPIFERFSTLGRQIQGCQQVLATAQFQEAQSWRALDEDSVLQNYDVLRQLLDRGQIGDDEFQEKIMQIHKRVHNSFVTNVDDPDGNDESNSDLKRNVDRSDFMFEAQCVVVLEMAQRYIQKFMWDSISSVMEELPGVLGIGADAKIALGYNRIFQKVKKNVTEKLAPVNECRSSQKSLHKMFKQVEWEPYKGLLVPDSVRHALVDIRRVDETIKRFRVDPT